MKDMTQEFKEAFIKSIAMKMAAVGRVIDEKQILLLDTFCENIASNGLIITEKA